MERSILAHKTVTMHSFNQQRSFRAYFRILKAVNPDFTLLVSFNFHNLK